MKGSAFNINSACPEEPYRAEDREIIVVSRSYPTKIGQNWTCIYNFFTPDKTQARFLGIFGPIPVRKKIYDRFIEKH